MFYWLVYKAGCLAPLKINGINITSLKYSTGYEPSCELPLLRTTWEKLSQGIPTYQSIAVNEQYVAQRSPIDLRLLDTRSSLSSCTKSSFMTVWPIPRSRIRPESRLTPSKASRRFTCLIGVSKGHQSSSDGGTKARICHPAFIYCVQRWVIPLQKMSSASKKIIRAHPSRLVYSTGQSQAA
jgi:hypothetical protein